MITALTNYYPMLLSWILILTVLMTVGLAGSTLKRPSLGHLVLATIIFVTIVGTVLGLLALLLAGIKLMTLFSASAETQLNGSILMSSTLVLGFLVLDKKSRSAKMSKTV